MFDKNDTAREDPKFVIGSFIMCVAADLAKKDKRSPAIWPEWSEDTKLWWEEIEQRMTRPVCLNFNWEAAKQEIKEAAENEEQFLDGHQDHMTSWRVGIKDGLWKAYNIMERHVTIKNAAKEGR